MVQGIFGVEIIMLIQWDGKKVIADYIRNQLEEDYASDQISLKEYMDPFTGSERKWAKKTAARVQITSLLVVMIRDYNKRLYIPLVSYRHSF